METFMDYFCLSCLGRQPPPQSGKPRVIAIERDPLAAPLDGERGVPGVSHRRAARIGLYAEAPENVPVPLAGLDTLAVWLREQVIAETKGLVECAGFGIGAPIGSDSN